MVRQFEGTRLYLPRNPVPACDSRHRARTNNCVHAVDGSQSGKDVRGPIGYPLTVALLGIPESETIRSLFYVFFFFFSPPFPLPSPKKTFLPLTFLNPNQNSLARRGLLLVAERVVLGS